jgi:dihydrofolate reductase
MKTYLFAAMSLDGFIADKDGGEDFLANAHWIEFTKLAEKISCFIVSRKAYEVVNQWADDKCSFDNIKAKKIIVSKNPELKLKEGYALASSPKAAIDLAKENGCKEILVAGGGQLNKAFLENNLVDEIFFTIEPCILGQGVDFAAGSEFAKKLNLIDIEKLDGGIVKLNYEVVR